MRAVFIAIAIATMASASLARPPYQVSMVETIVVTGTTVDPSKLSDKERLAHICQAAGLLKKHLQFQLQFEHEKDVAAKLTNDWILRLSCAPQKSD